MRRIKLVGSTLTFLAVSAAPAAAQRPYYCIPSDPDDAYYCIDGGGTGGTGNGNGTGTGIGTGTGTGTGGGTGGGTVTNRRQRLTISARPRRDFRRPISYRVTGILKDGDAVICRGQVTVTARRGGRIVARRTTRLNRSCRYTTRLRVKRRRLAHSGKLRLRARFGGNADAVPRKSGLVTVRYRL